MDFNVNPIDSDWTPIPVKQENESKEKKPIVRPKENRNFCERWLSLFSPWLTRCEDDSNRPYCRACQRPLDNNRFRLQRHERTAKHSRNQEILLNEGEDAVRLNLSNCKQRRRYIKKETPMKPNIESTLDSEIPLKKSAVPKTISTPNEKNDCRSFKPEKREFHNISDYGYSSNQYSRPQPAQPPPKKDSFDMFFEAISASVKTLPPKLAAEVKSRISQVIAEFELRAICEREAEEKAVISVPAQVTNALNLDPMLTTETSNANNTNSASSPTTESPPTVAQYVFSYRKRDT